jgi:hypothetical protein
VPVANFSSIVIKVLFYFLEQSAKEETEKRILEKKKGRGLSVNQGSIKVLIALTLGLIILENIRT